MMVNRRTQSERCETRRPPLPRDRGLSSLGLLMQLSGTLGMIAASVIALAGTFVRPLEVAPVLIDPTALEQVVMSLVVNALDAMGEGGVLTVEVVDVEANSYFKGE